MILKPSSTAAGSVLRNTMTQFDILGQEGLDHCGVGYRGEKRITNPNQKVSEERHRKKDTSESKKERRGNEQINKSRKRKNMKSEEMEMRQRRASGGIPSGTSLAVMKIVGIVFFFPFLITINAKKIFAEQRKIHRFVDWECSADCHPERSCWSYLRLCVGRRRPAELFS